MNLREIVAGTWRGFGPPPSALAMAPATEQADLIEVFKRDRRMELKREGRILKQYRLALGFAPAEHKEREGDGRTPEGDYAIDARNPKSSFHLSLRVSYPDSHDRAHAEQLGVSPGGDIYIHGLPNGLREFRTPHPRRDWTTGCVAVTDEEICEIWSLVPTGTRIVIHP